MAFLTLNQDEKALMIRLLNDAESSLGRPLRDKERKKAHKMIRERILAERRDKAAKVATTPQRALQEAGEVDSKSFTWKPNRRR